MLACGAGEGAFHEFIEPGLWSLIACRLDQIFKGGFVTIGDRGEGLRVLDRTLAEPLLQRALLGFSELIGLGHVGGEPGKLLALRLPPQVIKERREVTHERLHLLINFLRIDLATMLQVIQDACGSSTSVIRERAFLFRHLRLQQGDA
jgi:hypothetical protein